VKNGLFIISDKSDKYSNIISSEANGVKKKIYSQIKVLNIGNETVCRLLVLPAIRIRHIFQLTVGNFYKKILEKELNIDFIYVRRVIPVNNSFINFLKRVKTDSPECKIIYEIPTYPYNKEHRSVIEKIGLCIDKIFRKELKKYVDRIVTLSDDVVIFGIPTIKIINGIDCSDIPVQIPSGAHIINIIAVAQFAKWHGYDRLIRGLNNYYMKAQGQKICIHFVGSGPEINYYHQLVRRYNLSAHVFFHGPLSGRELTNIFNKSNIAACSLGGHRKGLYLSSELKSREYLARGLPMVASTKIDVIPPNFEYCLYFPEDDSSIDIEQIVKFYVSLLVNQTRFEMISKIRKFTEENCDVAKAMKPVVEYLK
jgi:glycosyltransferase involved in cell wall biosynthesis